MERKAVGITGKLWKKVDDEDVLLWQQLVNEGSTLREVGRRVGRHHATIKRHVTLSEEQSRTNQRRAMAHDNRANCGRKKQPWTHERLLHHIIQSALQMARRRAENKGLDIDINYDFIIGLYEEQKGLCLLTKMSFELDGQSKFRSNPYRPSIDRVDSKSGYTKGNVRLIIWGLNWAIGEWGEDVYKKIAVNYLDKK